MADALTVSVIVPTYNRADYLRQAINSLLAQTRRPDEIIVVDDGSTDRTGDVLTDFEAQIRIIRQPNSGRSAARNAGLDAARGSLIAFLDDDDLLPPDSLAKRIGFLSAHPEADVVYGDTRVIDAQGKIVGDFQRGNRSKPSGDVFAAMARQNLAPIHAYLFRRECLAKTGRFDTAISVGEDWDFWIRMAAAYRFAYLNAPVASYRFHAAMSSETSRERLAREGIAVQVRVFAMPAFDRLSGHERAKLYTRHAIWYLRISDYPGAQHYAYRALTTLPTYLPAHAVVVGASLLQTVAPNLLRSQLLRRLIKSRRLWMLAL